MKKSNDIQSRRKQLKLRITIVILIFLLAAIGLGVHVVQNYIPSKEHMSLTEYYGQPSDGEMVGKVKRGARHEVADGHKDNKTARRHGKVRVPCVRAI